MSTIAGAPSLKIFLCYRRNDNAHATDRLFDRLIDQFGRENVFYDVDSIPVGVNWRAYVVERVAKCEVFLAVVGDNWLDELRLRAGTDDLVRLEIEAALRRGVPIIPIQVGHANLPQRDHLPDTIAGLVDWQGIPLRPGPDFAGDMQRLIKRLKELACAFDPRQAQPEADSSRATPTAPQAAPLILGPEGIALDIPRTSPYLEVRQTGDVTVVRLLVNQLTMDTESQIRQVVDRGQARIVLNLSRVSYVDSMGLGMIVNLLRRVRLANGDMCICCLQPKMKDLWRMIPLDKLLVPYESEEAAIAALQDDSRRHDVRNGP